MKESDLSNVNTIVELQLIHSISERLYYESRINDASRIFSWCRKPSKLTDRCDHDMKEVALKIAKIQDKFMVELAEKG